MVAAIDEQIPTEEKNSVAVCGLLVTDAELFLKTDIHPVGRYCFLADWHARADHSVREHLEKTLRNGDAKWVICRTQSTDEALQALIHEGYDLHSEYEQGQVIYQLYKRK